MNNKPNENVVIKGYFVVVDKDEHRLLTQEMMLTTARGGIYYQQEKLLNKLKEHHQNFVEKDTHIIEVEVDEACITAASNHKFGIKKGHVTPIKGIKTYQEALVQLETAM